MIFRTVLKTTSTESAVLVGRAQAAKRSAFLFPAMKSGYWAISKSSLVGRLFVASCRSHLRHGAVDPAKVGVVLHTSVVLRWMISSINHTYLQLLRPKNRCRYPQANRITHPRSGNRSACYWAAAATNCFRSPGPPSV